MNLRRGIAAAVILLGSLTPAMADDIGDAIGDAQKAYKAGDLGAAKQALDLASHLIAQRNAEGLAKAFPGPFKGWKAEEAETSANAFASFNGSSATRRYSNAKDETLSISISADGPILAQMVMVLSNPQLAGTMGKIIKVGDRSAIQDRDGDITVSPR